MYAPSDSVTPVATERKDFWSFFYHYTAGKVPNISLSSFV